jgi:hypothetical protein
MAAAYRVLARSRELSLLTNDTGDSLVLMYC